MTTTNTHARPFILDSKTREFRPATEAEIERSHQALFARLSESQSQANPASAIAQALRALPTKAASRAVEPEQEAVTVTALSLADLETANAETAGLSEIVQGFFPARSVNLLAGDSGLGKSPLICQLAVCVAAGVPFLGQAVKQGTVIIADFENDAALAGMLRNVAKAVNANPADFMSRLHILQRPSQKAVLKAAKELGAALVIIDSLRGFDSQAEGKSDTAGALIARLQEHDGCWILMHHLRKQPADSPRPALCGPSDTSVLGWLENASGSRALTNQTFTRIAVDESDRASADLVLRGYFKGRGEFGPFHLERVYDEEQPIGYSRLTGDQLLNVNQRADWNKIRAAGKPLTFSEVVEILGGKSKASRFISACRNLGLVETDGHTMQSDRRYRFQPQNEQKP